MHAHKRFTVATNVQVYFCDPRSPWQRGSNENTNGLLRQYLPRGTDFSRISQSYLNAIALRLNQRPRKTLGFQTPAAQPPAGVAYLVAEVRNGKEAALTTSSRDTTDQCTSRSYWRRGSSTAVEIDRMRQCRMSADVIRTDALSAAGPLIVALPVDARVRKK